MFTAKKNTASPSTSNPSRSNSMFIQPKLNVGKSGDKYEAEADKAADRIVAKNNTSSTSFFPAAPGIQKQADEEVQKQEHPVVDPITPGVQLKEEESLQKREEEEIQKVEEEVQTQKDTVGEEHLGTDPPIQAKESSLAEVTPVTIQQKATEELQTKEEEVQEKEEEVQTVLQKKSDIDTDNTTGIEEKLKQTKGKGNALDPNIQAEMESGFGADFSGVRIHNDRDAVQMNQQLGAKAFTNGNDVYFNEGKYDPNSESGKHLLAHELTHTVQQGASANKIQKVEAQQEPEIGAPTTVVDISKGLNLSQDWLDYIAQQKSSKHHSIKAKIGSQFSGTIIIKQKGKPKEGEKQKFELANKIKGTFLDIQGMNFLHPLKDKAGITPILALDKFGDEQTTNGFLSIKTEKGAYTSDKKKFINSISENLDTLGLNGLSKFKAPKNLINTYENGGVNLQANDLSIGVDGFIQATGSIGITNSKFTFELASKVNVKGLAEGDFNLSKGEDGKLSGKASISADIANVNANITVEYIKGAVVIQGTGKMNSEKFTGEITLLVTDEARSKQMMHAALGVESMDTEKEKAVPKKPVEASPKTPKNQVLAGWGTVEAMITPWLQGTANIGIDSKGQVTIHGKVSVPNEVTLMEQKGKKEDLFKVEIRAGYGIPLVGQVFLFANIGMFMNAGFGPLVLKDVGFTGTYSTDPEILQNFSITGTLGINAFAILGLRAEAGVGVTILAHDVKAGVSVTAAAGIKAYAEATPVFEYKEARNPEGGKVGESRLKGHFEAAAQLFLQLAGSLFVELDSPWWSPAPDGREDYPIGEVQYPIGDSMGIGADIDWLVGGEEPPELKFSPVDFDADKFTTDVMADPPPGKKGKSDAKPEGKWSGKPGEGDQKNKPTTTGKGKGLPENAKKKEDLKKLPDEKKYMRGLDELSRLEKVKPKPTLSVVDAKIKKVKAKYGLEKAYIKSKKEGEATIYVEHKKQNNNKHLLKIPLMSIAEAIKLRHAAITDLELREAKAIGEKGSMEESKAKDMITAWLKAHPVVETAKVIDGVKTWNYFIDFGDKSKTVKGKLKGGNTDEKGVPKNEGDGELGEVTKFSDGHENHTLWVDISKKKPVLKIASTPTAVRIKLEDWKSKFANKEKIGGKVRRGKKTPELINDSLVLLGKIDRAILLFEDKSKTPKQLDSIDSTIEIHQKALAINMKTLFTRFDGVDKDISAIYVGNIKKVHPHARQIVLDTIDLLTIEEKGKFNSWGKLTKIMKGKEPFMNLWKNPMGFSEDYNKTIEDIITEVAKANMKNSVESRTKELIKTIKNRKTETKKHVDVAIKDFTLDIAIEPKLREKIKASISGGSGLPDHKYFIPDQVTTTEENGVYVAEYFTRYAKPINADGNYPALETIDENDAPKFRIEISFDKAKDIIPDTTEVRKVKGTNLKSKLGEVGRGEWDGGKAGANSDLPGFDNAHIIGDQFGGSGVNWGLNIHPSSSRYNQKEMAGIENKLASFYSDRKDGDGKSKPFDMEVTAGLKDDTNVAKEVQKLLDKEFDQDNLKTIKKTKDVLKDNVSGSAEILKTAESTLKNELQEAMTVDIKNAPAKFMKTMYKSNASGSSEKDDLSKAMGSNNKALDDMNAAKKVKYQEKRKDYLDDLGVTGADLNDPEKSSKDAVINDFNEFSDYEFDNTTKELSIGEDADYSVALENYKQKHVKDGKRVKKK